MSFATRARNWAGVSVILAAAAFSAVPVLGPAAAQAQEISDSHLQAAREALTAIKVTDRFDNILPAAANALKGELLRQNPNLEELINETVDAKTLAMAGRRGDLEREAATVFAKRFSEEELKGIAAFYNTPAGIKLRDNGPATTAEVFKAAEIWQRGVVRDLAQSVGEEMNRKAPPIADPAAAAGTEQPAAPAPGEPAPAN